MIDASTYKTYNTGLKFDKAHDTIHHGFMYTCAIDVRKNMKFTKVYPFVG